MGSALITQENLKGSTISGYSYVLDRHLIPFFGPTQMSAIDTLTIKAFDR